MSLFVLADTHLSLSTDKPMDVFGDRWSDHAARIRENWLRVVGEADTVVLPGDISWGMTLPEALPDLRYLHELPGHKILGKGNHDYWWQTSSKLEAFFKKEGLSSLSILHNNAYFAEGVNLCGSRGWFCESAAPAGVDYAKIVAREAGRLRLSLLARPDPDAETLVFLHFPPVFGDFICPEILAVLHEFGVRRCYFGHLHGQYRLPGSFGYEGILFTLVSSDYRSFLPYRIETKEFSPEIPDISRKGLDKADNIEYNTQVCIKGFDPEDKT